MPYVSGRPGSHTSLSLSTQLWGGLSALHAVVWLPWLLGGSGHGSVVVAVKSASVRDTDGLKPRSAGALKARGVCPVVKLAPFLASGKQCGCMHRVASGWGSGAGGAVGPGLWPDIGSYMCSQSGEAILWDVTGAQKRFVVKPVFKFIQCPTGTASYLFG